MSVTALPLRGAEPPEPPGVLGIRIKARRDGSCPIAVLALNRAAGGIDEVELTPDELDQLHAGIAETRAMLHQLARSRAGLAPASAKVLPFRPLRRP